MRPAPGLPAPTPAGTPDVRAERCVHSLMEQSGCRACVDACPTRAWVINDVALGIDPQRCDGCDLCVAACPEAAIVQRFRPAVRQTPTGAVALACCERVPAAGDDIPRMPCLHAIGTRDLLHLHRGGIRHLITSAGDCGSCPRGGALRLEDRLGAVNALLFSRGLAVVAHRRLDASGWVRVWRQTDAVARRKPVSRRGFLRAAIRETTERVEELADRAEGRYIAPGTLLPRSHPGDPVPFAPLLEPTKCSGCDACTRLCPHGAVSIEKDGGLPAAYIVHPDNCTGCGICTDVCEGEALTIAPWRPVVRRRFPLVNRRCASCGVSFHLPKTQERARSAGSLCPICSRANHHRHLFQVLG